MILANSPPRCRRCGARHRTWHKLADCLYGPVWVQGDGPFGSFAWCPRGLTIKLYDTRAEARQGKEFADRVRCGGMCRLDHSVEDLREPVRRGGRKVVGRW